MQQNGNRNSGGWSSQAIQVGNFSNNIIGIVQDTNLNYAGLTFGSGTANNSQIFIHQTGGDNNYVGNGAPIDPMTNPGNSSVGNGAINGGTVDVTNAGVNTALLETSSQYTVPVSGDQNGSVHGTDNSVGIMQDGQQNALALSVSGNGHNVGGGGAAGGVDLNSFTTSSTFFSSPSLIDPGAGQGGVVGLASQVGSDNTGVISVTGSDNAVSFSQNGSGNVNEVYVSGSGNLAIANQM